MSSLFKSSLFCVFGGVDSARLLTLVKFSITFILYTLDMYLGMFAFSDDSFDTHVTVLYP